MQHIYNFRDFGGHFSKNDGRVREGRLYRSGRLAKATDTDLAQLASLGIRTVIDLRTENEQAGSPDRVPEGSTMQQVHLPIKVKNHDESSFLRQMFSHRFGKKRNLNYFELTRAMYREYITDFKPVFGEVLRLAAQEENLPLLVHCTAGKDRTGVACSLLQGVLGVPFEVILQDYLQSNAYLQSFQQEMRKRLRLVNLLGVPSEKFMPLFEVHREYLDEAFEQIHETYGDVEGYVRRGLGLKDGEIQRLREVFLEQGG